MLELRLNCENCNKSLPYDSEEAMICTFECTFCKNCVDTIMQNVCPNCSGGFEKRPIRPQHHLAKHPPRQDRIYKPIDEAKFEKLLLKNKDIPPAKR